MTTATSDYAAQSSLIRLTHILYALHAVGLAIGAFGAASVVGSFLFGWPSLIAVIINYLRRDEVQGTWLESHFRWQIRTFWLALGASVVVLAIGLPTTLVLIGFGILSLGFLAIGLWTIYRIARGWLRLSRREGMPD